MESFNPNKVVAATKWSAVTEIMAKLVAPITSMVLARLLTPEAFGVVATITMLISFAEVFTDAGFQKYLVQHEFVDEEDREQSTTVAFWSNLLLSVIIWLIIIIFSAPLAEFVGNPGLGNVISIACVGIPIAAFSSIHMASYRRDFEYRVLFKVRAIGILIPIVVTIPLALFFKSYWALIIGTIVKDVCVVISLSYYSKWKPRLFYSFSKLKEMISFTIWTLIESISIWTASYIDIFIVGKSLSAYHLGLYKTSMTTATQVIGIISATVMPIIFATLSRVQSDNNEFRSTFFKFQHFLFFLVIPIGLYIYLYDDYVTMILLGEQWKEASYFIGLYGFSLSIHIVFSVMCSEAYRAVGKPKLSLLLQMLYLIIFIPVMFYMVKEDYAVLCFYRAFMNILMVLLNLCIVWIFLKISAIDMIKSLFPLIFASIILFAVGYYSKSRAGVLIEDISSGIAAAMAYILSLVIIFPKEKVFIKQILKKFLHKQA